jgi:hypothetical protein
VRENRYILDLGVFEKAPSAKTSRVSAAVAAVRLLEAIEAGPTLAAVAAQMQTSTRHLHRHAPLRFLTSEVRSCILTKEVDRLGLPDLVRIAQAAPRKQASLLDSMLADTQRSRRTAHKRATSTYPARAVLSVNPERVLTDRRTDEEHVAEVEALVVDVNQRLAHRSNRRTDGSALAEVESKLRKVRLGGIFTPGIESDEKTGRRVTLAKNEAAWAQRRRGDGINVVVAHPEVPGTGAELVEQYFAKDAIEKDFQTIKSLVELRPIHHRSDPKVRAHVCICVLALLLLRALDGRLKPAKVSSAAALETLEAVRLNLLLEGKTPFYTVTRTNAQARALLKTLGLIDLADDAKVCEVIMPR